MLCHRVLNAMLQPNEAAALMVAKTAHQAHLAKHAGGCGGTKGRGGGLPKRRRLLAKGRGRGSPKGTRARPEACRKQCEAGHWVTGVRPADACAVPKRPSAASSPPDPQRALACCYGRPAQHRRAEAAGARLAAQTRVGSAGSNRKGLPNEAAHPEEAPAAASRPGRCSSLQAITANSRSAASGPRCPATTARSPPPKPPKLIAFYRLPQQVIVVSACKSSLPLAARL